MADSDDITKPSISRRRLLVGAGVAAAAAAAPPCVALPVAGAGEGAQLVELWHRLLRAHEVQDDLNAREVAAARRLPTWAQWGGRNGMGVAVCEPEWTDEMLREHAIPPELGRRPSREDIQKLNRERLDAELARFLPGDVVDLPPARRRELHAAAHARPEVVAVVAANARRIAAFEARVAGQRAEELKVGLPELYERQVQAGIAVSAIADAIAGADPRTLVDMVLTLRVWKIDALEWGYRDRADAAGYDECVLSVLDALEAGLPPDVAAMIPPIHLLGWDRPDAGKAAAVTL